MNVLSRALLASSLLVLVPGCELLEQLFACDYETDPECEDPTRGQIVGQVQLPEAGSAAVASVNGRSVDASGAVAALQQALRDSGRAPALSRSRVPRALDHNLVEPAKLRSERFRPGEVIVRAHRPIREDKPLRAAFAAQLSDELTAALNKPVFVTLRLCGTPYRCLAKLDDENGKPLSLTDTQEAALLLDGHPDLVYAERNLILQMAATPNDEFYTFQWHYAAIDMQAAWDITTGSSDVVAAVIDTGILLDHPDLEGRVIGGADLIDDVEVANDGDGRDADGDDAGDKACGGSCHSHHGTHVAGTMGAATNNGLMVSGVSWEGGMLAVRVLGAGGGSLADIADGIYWSIGDLVDGVPQNDNPADVINMSLGGQGESQALDEAVRDAVAAGAIVVVAAGNDSVDASGFTPANTPDAITVASVGNTGAEQARHKKASYSNFGSRIDVAGPGGEQSRDVDGDGQGDGVLSTLGDYVAYYQGTSMAAPHVAGVAMLLKSQDINLSQEEARDLLTSSADDNIDCPEGCGAGLISAAGALFEQEGPVNGPRVVASPSFVRVGKGQLQTTVAFKNFGTATAGTVFSVGGPDRAKVTVNTNTANITPKDTVTLVLDIDRTGDDVGEATVTAQWDGGTSEARVVWNADVLATAQTVIVAPVRVSDDGSLEVIFNRRVETTAIQQFNYKLFNLDPGTYLVVGLADLNNNDSFDDPEDAVGIFVPSASGGDGVACSQAGDCSRVGVVAGETIENADFLVAPGFNTGDDNTGGTGDGSLGDACASNGECGGGLYCETDFPSGLCTTDCLSDNDCPDSGLCFPIVGGGEEYQVCLQACTEDADCGRSGYVCDEFSTCFPS